MRRIGVMAVACGLTAAAHAAPCVTAIPGCAEWVPLRGGPGRSLVYRSYRLDKKNAAITRALIVVHGSSRDADNNFRTALAAALLAGALEDTILISPRFASADGRGCKDLLASDEISWSCSGDSWRSGGTASSNELLNSFDFTDEILRKLARKDVFPNLKKIVLAGHSAGGQYVTRYEMANLAHDTLGVPLTYVVANSSSYAYLDATRPLPDDSGFGPFRDGRNCTTYDKWPYGLKNRTGYASKLSDDKLKEQLAARPVTYLMGELDIFPLGGFDSSCPAMAQGPTRLARGQAFVKYVNEKYGAHHVIKVVPLCGHNSRAIFTSEAALPFLFPAQ